MSEVYSAILWGWAPHFLTSAQHTVTEAFTSLGHPGRTDFTIVGIKWTSDTTFDIFMDRDFEIKGSSSFSQVEQRSVELYENHPDRNSIYSDGRQHERRHRELKEKMRGQALAEALKAGSIDSRFEYFFGAPAAVGELQVYPVVMLEQKFYETAPRLATHERDNITITPGIVEALIAELLSHATMSLNLPEPGALYGDNPDILRKAAQDFVGSVLTCAGYWFGYTSDTLLHAISTLPYEGRSSKGRFIIARIESSNIIASLRLDSPVDLRDTRAARKLLEGSGNAAHVLMDGEKVYGFGLVSPDYDPTTEEVFEIEVEGRGRWTLFSGNKPLISFEDGRPTLPQVNVDIELLIDVLLRTLSAPDTASLTRLALAVAENEHGAMLIISDDAESEAKRLSPQAWTVSPEVLSSEIVSQLTSIDGAILVNPQGKCHAVGVILDGKANGKGVPARGSRYNNAIRYLESDPPSTVILVYSSDGSIDILPHLRKRIYRETITTAIVNYRVAADDYIEGLTQDQFGPRRFVARTRQEVEELQFYLSPTQCATLNEISRKVRDWEKTKGGIVITQADFVADPDMNDSYFF
ncbi:diadenylate cyclase [Amycolatopsis nivea]|uniref:diadenylate cyclase n=1 Tax=Amycolatopsis nivea TaxID=1644109 RepID=UPI00106FD1EE|nr:diadenylate cyclase [Amycolatopsis nivea]